MSIAKHLQQLTQIDWREVRVVPHIRRYINLYLALLQAGFALPDLLPSLRCALTAPFHPYFLKRKLLKKRSIFCGTFPKGARTFLQKTTCGLRACLFSDCLAHSLARLT